MTAFANHTRLPRQLAAPLMVGALLLAAGCADDETGPDPESGQADNGAAEENPTQDDANDQDDAEHDDHEHDDAEHDEAGQDSADGEIELTEVQDNDSPESCWAVIEDSVYDLTDWIDEHPGGSARIEGLCGTDATEQFTEQHGGDDHPESHLADFEIGSLAD